MTNREYKIDGKFEQMNMAFEPRQFHFDPEHKQQFMDLKERGEYIECPCCDKKYNVIYKRNIYRSMVVALWGLANGGVGAVSASVSDFSKFEMWGIIVKLSDAKGHWGITQKGRAFLAGQISVPKSVFIQNNTKIGESEEMVSIEEFKKKV